MASLPRIITVDPTGRVAQQVRSALDLMDRLAVQIDTPNAEEALLELSRASCQAIISAWALGDHTQGWELAAKARQAQTEVNVIILADYDDTELDDDIVESSPFVYLRRPYDATRFINALTAALDGGDVRAAMQPSQPTMITTGTPDYGPVPRMDLERANEILETVRTDTEALAVVLAARNGEVLLERGAMGYLDRNELTQVLLPAVNTTINIRHQVGGNATTLQFYDGEEYDVFVLSVGLHHYLCIIFDGHLGSRQFGAVNRFGRRSAEDLIGLVGAEAWIVLPQQAEQPSKPAQPRRSDVVRTVHTQAEEPSPPLERAQDLMPDPPTPASESPKMEAIPELDLDVLFGNEAEAAADDLFDISNLEQLAREVDEKQSGSQISLDDADKLGIFKLDE